MYKAEHCLRVPLRPSPSLITNNLCALAGGGLAYVHTRSAAIVPSLPPSADSSAAAASLETSKVDVQDYSLIQAVASCVVDGISLLTLSNEAGLQVWDGTGSQLLFAWQLPRTPAPAASPHHADFVRGLAFNLAADGSVQLCAGCSSGAIHVFEVAPGMRLKHAATLQHGGRPIAALGSAFQSRRGGWADDVQGGELVACDDEGVLRVWRASSSTTYADTGISTRTGTPCASLAVRRGFIVCAGTDGCVRIHSLKDGELRYELVAHSRWLSAMDIHPSRDIIATVAQDSTLGVWQLPIAMSKAACLLSVCSLHDVLTGVSFCGKHGDDVAAVAYDTEALMLWHANTNAL